MLISPTATITFTKALLQAQLRNRAFLPTGPIARAIRSTTMQTPKAKLTDWVSPDSKDGEFKRQPTSFRRTISRSPDAEFPAERNRYHLYVSYACPWAHRTLIVRKLKGLESIIDYTVVHYQMGENGWRFVKEDEEEVYDVEKHVVPDPLYDAKELREIYLKSDPNFVGRYTVPVLWDKKKQVVVNNESSEIIRMMYTEFDDFVEEKFRGLEFLKGETDEMNKWIYDEVNNGVYKSGFATTQSAYERNVLVLFSALDRIEQILSTSPGPYLLGTELTEVDIRLYPTIVRFDPVYVQHFKCNIRDIRSGYPNIHRWLRHLYWDFDAFKDTTNFKHIKRHYTKSHTQINPFRITPLGPVPNILEKDK